MKRIFVLCAFAAALLFPVIAAAQSSEPTPRIVVNGEGEVSIAPDMAILNLTVLREAETARMAVSAGNEAMVAVIEAMKSAGIAERDLQTSEFSISPRYVYPNKSSDRQQPEIVAYSVSNTLVVRVRDLKLVGQVLDTSVSLGVNQGGNITFTNDDPSEAIALARRNAVADAMDKAKTLAASAGVSTGRILEMSEQSHRPSPMPIMRGRAMAMEASDAVPVQSGENTYRVQVNMTFAIEQ